MRAAADESSPRITRQSSVPSGPSLLKDQSNCYAERGRGPGPRMSVSGLVSRASPVQTAVRNCTRDEGGPFGFGDQVADPKPPQAAVVKSHGGERCGNAGTMISAGTVERGERTSTLSR